MLPLLASLALAAAPPAAAPGCAGQQGCAKADASQVFALADKLFAAGDLSGAATLLEAVTHDKHADLRAEARFRLATVREKMNDLEGAAGELRALLAEQPGANRARLELARILGRMGKADEAKKELGKAEAIGLPPEVEQNVRRFAGTLKTDRDRGLTVEITAGPDSNINRATGSQFIDTIIAPFELDADARRTSGFGASASANGFIRVPVGGTSLLTHAGMRADLYDKARFNDVQLTADSGPEFQLGDARLRPAAEVERRWYGGHGFSAGYGGDLDFVSTLSETSQLELRLSGVRQTVDRNRDQDGWRSSASAALTHAWAGGAIGQLSLRYGRLDARIKPESLRQWGAGLLMAKQWPKMTLFGEVDYTRTHGIAPIFLFGDTRRDHRWDLTGGAIFTGARLAGFSPVVRLTHSDSRADIVLYDYRRTRLDVGLTRTF